jgi:hypothetical protein
MVPTELDIFRYAYLRQSGAVATVTSEEFNPSNCTIMIVRLLFGAYELFGPQSRNYSTLPSHHDKKICYLLITDELSLQHPIIAESILVSQTSTPWHVFVMKRLMYPNPAKTMKAIKLSLFRLFPFAKFILYYDLKYRMRGNPLRFLEICHYHMKEANVSHAIYRHFADKPIEDEFIGAQERLQFQHTQGVVRNISEELSDIARQQKQYTDEGFFDAIRGQKPVLVDSAIIVFKNNEPNLHRFFCAWMNEVILFSRRDQLSYPYVEHKLNITGYKIPKDLLFRFFIKIPHGYVTLSHKKKEQQKKVIRKRNKEVRLTRYKSRENRQEKEIQGVQKTLKSLQKPKAKIGNSNEANF